MPYGIDDLVYDIASHGFDAKGRPLAFIALCRADWMRCRDEAVESSKYNMAGALELSERGLIVCGVQIKMWELT